jgi:hypothetical protein
MNDSDDAGDEPLSAAQRADLTEQFEANGYATFRLGVDRRAFDTLMQYIREHHIATLTDVDKAAGTVTVTKRPFGSLELG